MGKNGNGEGSTYKTIIKNKRKKFLDKMCKICQNCNQKCNRIIFEKCDKCKNCKEDCLKYCDRYYCYSKWVAQATINGKHKTIATTNKQNLTNIEKRNILTKVDMGKYVDKNNITVHSFLKMLEDKKLESNLITENTYLRNMCVLNKINSLEIGKKKIQELQYTDIQNSLNAINEQSQSAIDKMYDIFNSACKKAIEDKILSETPMKNVIKPPSKKSSKVAMPFSVDEEYKLIHYVCTNDLILDSKCTIDPKTLKNIILIALLTGMRIRRNMCFKL